MPVIECIELFVESTDIKSISLPDCSSYPRERLWNDSEVKGYFNNNKWHHIHCKGSSEGRHRTCLNGKRVILTGDSTTRQWFLHLMQALNCKLTTPKWTSKKWYTWSICESKSNKLRIEWVPHAMPFAGYISFSDIHSIPEVLEGIENTTETVVLIHMYAHFVSFHHSIFKQQSHSSV